jgi:hypothetical protein
LQKLNDNPSLKYEKISEFREKEKSIEAKKQDISYLPDENIKEYSKNDYSRENKALRDYL